MGNNSVVPIVEPYRSIKTRPRRMSSVEFRQVILRAHMKVIRLDSQPNPSSYQDCCEIESIDLVLRPTTSDREARRIQQQKFWKQYHRAQRQLTNFKNARLASRH